MGSRFASAVYPGGGLVDADCKVASTSGAFNVSARAMISVERVTATTF